MLENCGYYVFFFVEKAQFSSICRCVEKRRNPVRMRGMVGFEVAMCANYVVAFLTDNRIRAKQLSCKFRCTKRVHVFVWIPEN